MLWFWKYQYCVIFACFSSFDFVVFNSPVATPAHRLLGLSQILRLPFILEKANLLAVCVCATAHGPIHQFINSGSFHWALSLFIYFRSMSGLLRSCCRRPECNNHVRSRRSLNFIRLRFTPAHLLEPELSYAITYFKKYNSYQTGCFLKHWICIEHWISSPIQWTVPILRITSSEPWIVQ